MRKIVYCCLLLVLLCCKDRYEPPVKAPESGYLVIEGYISADGPAEIRLTRSIPLDDTARLINETLAKVELQGRDNSTFNLTENGQGIYRYNRQTLNPAQQYRLYIKTRAGKEYASEYVKVKIAPLIDKVDWIRDNAGGLQISIATHDPNNSTWYYRWTTEETWEYHSSYYTSLDFKRDSVTKEIIGIQWRYPDMSTERRWYICWSNQNATNLILGSSAKLSIDSIHKPLVYIPVNDIKLSVLYSLNVKQYALSKEEYEFLEKMRKNSEETGNIFGRQPADLKGNIRCLSDPKEPVIGFIGIANRQEKRIWIHRSEVPDWRYILSCETHIVPVDSAAYYSMYMPVSPYEYDATGIVKYLAVSPNCVDCRLRGGVIAKPSFWP
ncbi:DUF4249 domain-containing protein [Longitalea luteola]|uniref:DUF4249 domain-containing protein n=1 Tax=Longitalea luteola TaxID=2812563 RepID=UPI001A95E947|nr:DUF4249 domain-containing protein [Longitalea luteola]